RSSNDQTKPKVLRYCHGAGWSSGPSPGLAAIGGWRRISKRPFPAAKRGFIWLRFSCWHAGSRGRLQLIDISTRKHNFSDSWPDTQIFDLWQDPQERYDIFMNNYTEHTWTLVSISAAIKDLMKTYVQYLPRKQQSTSYFGPITLQQ